MIINTYQLDKLKENQSNFYLLYGENEGYKNQLIKDILSVGFKDNINRYDESEVINNFDNLITQFTNKSFFEDKKIIIISRATEKINKFFEDIISRNIDDIRIVINAGSLDKKSKLRANFEKKENLICIPFYSDDSLTLGKLANNFFKDKKISISQETINKSFQNVMKSKIFTGIDNFKKSFVYNPRDVSGEEVPTETPKEEPKVDA